MANLFKDRLGWAKLIVKGTEWDVAHGHRLRRRLERARLTAEDGSGDWTGAVNGALQVYPPSLLEKIIRSVHAEFFLERIAAGGADDKWARSIALPLADRPETLFVATKTLPKQQLAVIRRLVTSKDAWTPGKVLTKAYVQSGPSAGANLKPLRERDSAATIITRLGKLGFRIRSARGARADGLKLPPGESGYRLFTQE